MIDKLVLGVFIMEFVFIFINYINCHKFKANSMSMKAKGFPIYIYICKIGMR